MEVPSCPLLRGERLEEWPRAMAFSLAGDVVHVGDAGGEVHTISLDPAVGVERVLVHDAPVADLGVAHDGAVITSGEDGAVMRTVPGSGEKPDVLFPAGRTWTGEIAVARGKRRVAVVRGRRPLLIDLEARKCVEGEALASTPGGLAFSANGERLAVAHNGGVSLLDARAGNVVRTFRWSTAMLNVAWRPGGSVIACGCQDQTLHFWRLPDGRDSMMEGFPAKPASLSWSAEGHLLATSGAPAALVWHFEGGGPEGKPPTMLEGHEDIVTLVAFAPMGELIATGGRDGQVCLFDPRMGELGPLARVETEGEPTALAWHPKGEVLAVADEGGRLSILDARVRR